MHESFNVWVKKIIPFRFGYWSGVQYIEHYYLSRREKMLVHITRRKMSGRFFLYSDIICIVYQFSIYFFIYIYGTNFFCCGTAASTVSDFNELQRTRPTRLDAAPNKMASMNPPRFRRRLLFSIMYSTTTCFFNKFYQPFPLPCKQQTDFLF